MSRHGKSTIFISIAECFGPNEKLPMSNDLLYALIQGCEEALKMLHKKYPLMEIMSLSGNYCSDKKSAAINW
jgi:hypothetical protein